MKHSGMRYSGLIPLWLLLGCSTTASYDRYDVAAHVAERVESAEGGEPTLTTCCDESECGSGGYGPERFESREVVVVLRDGSEHTLWSERALSYEGSLVIVSDRHSFVAFDFEDVEEVRVEEPNTRLIVGVVSGVVAAGLITGITYMALNWPDPSPSLSATDLAGAGVAVGVGRGFAY